MYPLKKSIKFQSVKKMNKTDIHINVGIESMQRPKTEENLGINIFGTQTSPTIAVNGRETIRHWRHDKLNTLVKENFKI